MNYDTESWYKLYIRESTEDRVLPVLNRALRDFLLRLAKSRKDATILAKTENPGADVARAIGAHADEAATVEAFIRSMLEDGYLSHRKGRLWITNFVRAQEARSPGARRQKVYREKHPKTKRDVTGDARETVKEDASLSVTSDVTSDEHATSQEIRSDPIRSETTTGAGGGGRPEQSVDPDARVPCPTPLPLADAVFAGLEVDVQMPRAVAEANLLAWARQQAAVPTDVRPISAWVRCGLAAIRARWSDSNRRAEMRALAKPVVEPVAPRAGTEPPVRTMAEIRAERAASGRQGAVS